MTTTFKYIELTDAIGGECECCGSYYWGSGKQVYVNDRLVWEHTSDGHMGGGFTTEGSMIDAVIAEWYAVLLKTVDQRYPEETGQEGKADKESDYIDCQESVVNIVDRCTPENMPFAEFLQLKMIALWIEDTSREVVEVIFEEGNTYE
jgi:hypothetical protein